MRRGQTEMIGLAFIVIMVVIGVVLYAKFSNPKQADTRVDGGTSFLVSLTETTVPECGTSFARVAAACVEGGSRCGDPCGALDRVLRYVTSASLDSRGMKYNLSLEGTDVMVYTDDCMSGDPAVDLAAAPNVPIVLSSGKGSRRLTLALCR